MENAKIGSKEAIALLVTIAFNHIIMNVTKSIIDTTSSASLLNILYVGVISIIFTTIICYFLNKFPTLDLLDISEYLGGKILKWIIGLLFVGYFIFFAGILSNMFSTFLEISYFQLVKTFYIVALLVIAAIAGCTMRHNAIYRANFIIFPLLIISTLFIFIADYRYFEFEKMYPLLGNGVFTTFVAGLSNMFAFQGLAYIFFLPPELKEPDKLKKVAITSVILSCIFLLICIGIILFMFYCFVETDELLPLYSAVKYIEYGSFIQKLDSTFVLIWIISFVSYLGVALKFSSKILKKLTNVENENIFTYLLGIALLFIALWPKNYGVSTFLADTVYKYAFFILIVGISFLILFSATIKQKKRKWFK